MYSYRYSVEVHPDIGSYQIIARCALVNGGSFEGDRVSIFVRQHPVVEVDLGRRSGRHANHERSVPVDVILALQ